MLERYGHGGDLLTAQETFGRPQDQFIDFSSNMNPLGPPEAVERIMKEGWRDIVNYPDPAVRGFRGAIARAYDIPEASILAGNGAAELIDLVVRTLRPKVTGIARPSFSEYEEAVEKAGGSIHDLVLSRQHGFILDRSAVREAAQSSDLLFLGHPNNPTGRLISHDVLQQLSMERIPVILDEAFIDFCPDEAERSMIRQAASSERLFVVRSMTKFFAIPGIRLGFIVAHPSWIARMRRLQVPWSVNFLAQSIGTAVMEDRAYIERTKTWLASERDWFVSQLAQLGLEVVPSDTNFLLFSFPEASGITVKLAQKYLGRRGILIRDASLFPGLGERNARIAIRLRPDNERLLQELERLLRGGLEEAET